MSRKGLTGIRIAAILGPVLGVGIVCTALWEWSVLSRHNTIQELQDVPVHSAVRLIGVVTYVDEPGQRFWIQDETGAMPVSIERGQAPVRVGEEVSVDGIKAAHYDPRKGPVSVELQRIAVHPAAAHVRLPHAPAASRASCTRCRCC